MGWVRSATLQGLSHRPQIKCNHLTLGTNHVNFKLTLIPLGLARKSLNNRPALNQDNEHSLLLIVLRQPLL